MLEVCHRRMAAASWSRVPPKAAKMWDLAGVEMSDRFLSKRKLLQLLFGRSGL